MVLGFSGKISSGKTSITKALAARLNWPRVSFGDFVRSVANARGLGDERVILQQLGEELLNVDAYNFCKAVLSQSDWQKGYLIIDGIRHETVLENIRKIIYPFPLIHIYLSISEDTRQNRLNQENKVDNLHSTEHENYNSLPDTADIKLEVNDNIDDSLTTLLQILSNKYGLMLV